MVVGVALNFFGVMKVAACLFLLGAVCFGGMQMLQTYEGRDVVIRRLRRIMTLADVLFIVSGLLLLEQNFNFLMPLFQKYGMQGMVYYAQYVVHNNWSWCFSWQPCWNSIPCTESPTNSPKRQKNYKS